MRATTLTTLAVIGIAAVMAQRPSNTSICDYYTTALLKDNTAENQAKVVTLVVNTAVIGNYTQPNVGIMVPGILAQGQTYNGTAVNLLPYFNGMLASSNRGGDSGVSVNFLDDGGAAPLKLNKPANGQSSNQYDLLTHLYEYFGVLLGCTMQGGQAYPAYAGDASQYEVHKFMALDPYQLGYFITQVGLAAASFGVTEEDATYVGQALGKLFGQRCSPPTTVVPAQGPQLQSMCTDSSCPLAVENATCGLYDNNGTSVAPMNATTPGMNGTTAPGGKNGTMNGTTSSSASPSSPARPTSGAVVIMGPAGGSLAVVAVMAAAMVLAVGV